MLFQAIDSYALKNKLIESPECSREMLDVSGKKQFDKFFASLMERNMTRTEFIKGPGSSMLFDPKKGFKLLREKCSHRSHPYTNLLNSKTLPFNHYQRKPF